MARIAIDFGGVLSIHDRKRTDHTTEHINTSIDMPDVITNLQKLVDVGYHLNIVSFCGRRRAIATKQVVDETELFENQFYVKDKQYKVDVCASQGCHFMIDDRIDILRTFSDSNTIPILFSNRRNSEFVTFDNWNDLTDYILQYKPFKNEPSYELQGYECHNI